MQLTVTVALVLALGSQLSADAPEPQLVVIVNAANPTTLTALDLEAVFLRKQVDWDSGERVLAINGSAESPRRTRFDRVVLRMSAEQAARYWLDRRIRGGGMSPREVGDPALTVKLVARLAGAIGYVTDDTALEGVRVIAHIRNDKVVIP